MAGAMVELNGRTVDATWPSAGIVDACAFRVGDSRLIHEPTHAKPNLVRGRCGIVASVAETPRARAQWADSTVTCPTCVARGSRPLWHARPKN